MTDPTPIPTPRPPARESWLAKGLVLGLLAAAALFFGLSWQIHSGASGAAGLVVDEKALDFGEIWESGEFTWEFPIENASSRTIAVSAFDLTCDCMKVEPAALTLAPGEVRSCRASLKVGGIPGGAPSLAPRPFETQITPIVAGETGIGQPSWRVHGVVRRVALLKPASLYFDQLSHESGALRSEVVTATSAEPVEAWAVQCDPKKLSVSAIRSRTDPRTFDIVVTPQTTSLPSGPFKTTVRLVANSSAGKELPAIELVVEGVVIEDVQAVPETLFFGTNPLGESKTETVVLRSLKGVAFRVVKVENDSPDLTVEPEKGERGSEGTYRMTQRFTRKGFHTGVVLFHVRREGQELMKIPVPWSYYGEER